MKLIIGLGNPGQQYENTRHNAGFIVLDELAKEFGAPAFKTEKKFDAEITEVFSGGEKTLLAKPQTFMNRSGEALQKLLDFYKIPLENLAVIHDDLDIDLGTYKISPDSSAGGHNGIVSIIEKLGTQRFKRVRIGIEGAQNKKLRVMSGSDFVLQDFSNEELELIKNLTKEIYAELS